jgi:serine/threonine protein phosphatase PrpC
MKKGRLNHLKINTADLLEVKNLKDTKNLEMKSELNEEKETRKSKEILLDGGVASSKAGKLQRITFSPAKKNAVNFNSPITTTNANNKTNLFTKFNNHSNIESKPLAVQNFQSEKTEKNNLNSILKNLNNLNPQYGKPLNPLDNQNFSPKNDKNLSKRFSHQISLNNVNVKHSGNVTSPSNINTNSAVNKRSTSSLISLAKNESDIKSNNYSSYYANQVNLSKNHFNKPGSSSNTSSYKNSLISNHHNQNNQIENSQYKNLNMIAGLNNITNLGIPHSTTNSHSGSNNSYLNAFFNQSNQNNQNQSTKTTDKDKYNSVNLNNNHLPLTNTNANISSYNLSNLTNVNNSQGLNNLNNINNINRISSPKQNINSNHTQQAEQVQQTQQGQNNQHPKPINNTRINKELKSFSNDNLYHVQTNRNTLNLNNKNITNSNFSSFSINQSQNTTLTTSVNLNNSTTAVNKTDSTVSNIPSVNISSSNSPIKHSSNTILDKEDKETKEKSQSINTTTQPQSEGISVSSLINNQNIPLSLSNLTVYFPFYESTKCSSKSLGTIRAYAANTYQGIIRNYNEDRVSIILNIAKPNNFIGTWPKCSFFGIYDGHGGSLCADFLRDHLHSYVIKDANFPHNPEEALRRGFEKAEEDFIYTQAMTKNLEVLDKSGSCAVVALIVEDVLYIANVGDSRAVMSLNSGKNFDVLTNDHKPNEEGENRRILANGGKVYQTQTPAKLLNMPNIIPSNTNPNQVLIGPYRVFPGRLSVSRTFGDVEAKISKFGGISGVVVATPEITKLNLNNDNKKPDFLVLGCDGIFDQISNKDIIDSVWMTMTNKDENRPKDLHSQCALGVDMIMKSSLVRRTLDNVTVLLIAFQNFENTVNNYNSGRIRSNDNFSPKSSFYLYNVIENKEENIIQSNIVNSNSGHHVNHALSNSTSSNNNCITSIENNKYNSNASNDDKTTAGNVYCITEPDLKRNDRSPGKINNNTNKLHQNSNASANLNKKNSRDNSRMSGTNEDVKVNKVKSLSPKGRDNVYANYGSHGNNKSSLFANTKPYDKTHANPLSNSHESVGVSKNNKMTSNSIISASGNISKDKLNKVFSFEVNNKIVQSPKNKKPIGGNKINNYEYNFPNLVNYYIDSLNKLNTGNISGSNFTNNSGYLKKRDSSKSKRTNSKFEKNEGLGTSKSNLHTSFKKA